MISGLLNALRIHLMEIFGRRFYARLVSEISLITIYAQNPFFGDQASLVIRVRTPFLTAILIL